MDDLDRKILSLLAKNARMPVKEIAEQVALTSPAVSSRIHKLETDVWVLVVPSFWNCRIRCSSWGMLPQLTLMRKV